MSTYGMKKLVLSTLVLASVPMFASARTETSSRLSNGQLRAIYKVLKMHEDGQKPIGGCTIKSLNADVPNGDRVLINDVWLFVDGSEGDGIGHFNFSKSSDRSVKSRKVEVSDSGGLKEVTITRFWFTPKEQAEIEKKECRRNPFGCLLPRPPAREVADWDDHSITKIAWDSSGVKLLENIGVDNHGVSTVQDRCAE